MKLFNILLEARSTDKLGYFLTITVSAFNIEIAKKLVFNKSIELELNNYRI
jgi:hypothetical protein